MMKNKNTIAKLLAEEDIFVVHKQMDTAYFDVKNRELGLPIWKENTMTDVEEELLICHEIGHALWTPLDMMEKTKLRKIEHSVVNVLEDARIEQKVMNKYLGSVRIFKEGYKTLTEKDFFGINGKDLSKLNLVDRINLHYKQQKDIPFSSDEEIWVEKAGKTTTPDEVLDLAEELIAWMQENPKSMGEQDESGEDVNIGKSDETSTSTSSSSSSSSESSESSKTEKTKELKDLAKELADAVKNGDGDLANDLLKEHMESKKDKSNDSSDTSGDADAGNGDDGTNGDGNNDTNETETDSSKDINKPIDTPDVIEGGNNGSGPAAMPNITAETAKKFGKALDDARDKNAESKSYVKVNDIDLKEVTVPYKTVVDQLQEWYIKHSCERYYTNTLEEVEEKKKSSKKTVAYMVKEFEMKKSADAYARAAVSKTGSLDMGKLHTYKYNEDLFRKVTTLPGATNHGLVMCLDWSGSMAGNLKDTLSQLFNLIWFCRRTKIPFEVYAFSDQYNKHSDWNVGKEVGCFQLAQFSMLNFFSSKMNNEEEMKMMHYLWMISSQWGYRDWRNVGFPITCPRDFNLGGTPLNQAIIAMMKIVPQFKIDNRLQKVQTIFLTDGAGCALHYKNEWILDTHESSARYGEHYLGYSSIRGETCVVTDPITNTTITTEGKYWDTTPVLLQLLKKRVPEMNVIGFFVAGSGRKGKVKASTLRYAVEGWSYKHEGDKEIRSALLELKKNNVFVAKSKGYDSYFILPGSMKTEEFELSDDLVGASKAKLKTAFGKSTAGRVSSRPLLNKFVELVA